MASDDGHGDAGARGTWGFAASGFGGRGASGEFRVDGADRLGKPDASERACLGERGRKRLRRDGGSREVGGFADHLVLRVIEMDVGRIFHGDVEGAEDELGAVEVDGVADKGVDDLHERGLDAFLTLDKSDGVKARLGRGAHAAEHALMEVAKGFAAEGGRAARDSVDLDVGAEAEVAGVEQH
jgi:hypothetical protein